MRLNHAVFTGVLLFTVAGIADLNSPAELARRCAPESAGEDVLYSNDFKWGYALVELKSRFLEIYSSPKRLGRRAYFESSSGTLVMPADAARGGDVRVPPGFVNSVRRHVEEALRLEYIDAVFFPDMGHSHFLVPLDSYREKYSKRPVSEMSRLYEDYFADPDLKVVYHTAEQLTMTDSEKKLLPDRRVQWRFFSRNLVGDNRGEGRLELLQNPGHSHNTLAGVSGYYWWGAGFNISANAKGCIAYRDGETVKYFDLSLDDLRPAPGAGW